MSRFDAVVFDLDGTLLDTENLSIAAGVLALRQIGHEVSPAFFETLVGVHDEEGARRLAAHVGVEIDSDALKHAWDTQGDILYREGGILLKPGVLELFELIDAAGLPMAIATSSRRERAAVKVELAGLAHRVKHVVSFNDVARGKPAPDPFLLAAALLGVAPGRCLAFEDSEIGAQAAWDAGMTVVQVPDVLSTQGRFAHHVAPTLLDGARAAGLLPPI